MNILNKVSISKQIYIIIRNIKGMNLKEKSISEDMYITIYKYSWTFIFASWRVGTSEGSTDLFSMSSGQRDMQESFLRGWSEILESYFVIQCFSWCHCFSGVESTFCIAYFLMLGSVCSHASTIFGIYILIFSNEITWPN